MATIQGHLTLIGEEFNPDDVTTTLRIQPQWLRQKNEILGNGQIFGHFEWGISTNTVECSDLSPVADQLMNFMKSRAHLLTYVANKFCAAWNILFSISSTEDFPATYLAADFVRVAAEINAMIGFDVIIYPK